MPSIEELPAPPDAVLVAIRKEETVRIVRDLAEQGAGGVVCYSSGFSEKGPFGVELQERLVAASSDMAVVGPNSIGFLNCLDGAAVWRDIHGGKRISQGVAIIGQSSNFALKVSLNDRSLPLAYSISVGDEAVLRMSDYMMRVLEDSRVKAIGLFIEGIGCIDAFSQACEHALRLGIPVVAMKVGSSNAAQEIAAMHTSSLTGSDVLYDAFFDRLDIIRVRSISSFIETLKYLSLSGDSKGRRLRVLTCSGGDAALAADLTERAGLSLPRLSDSQIAALSKQLPDSSTIFNPVDYFGPVWGDESALCECFLVAMEGDVDVVVLVLDYPHLLLPESEPWGASIEALINAKQRAGKLVVVAASLPELLPERVRDRLIEHHIVPLQGLDDAIEAISAAAKWVERRVAKIDLAKNGHLRLPMLPHLVGKPYVLNEWESKCRLAEAGLKPPLGALVSATEAARAASDIGFPVALKVVSSDLPHKSDVGGVKLNLQSEGEVVASIQELSHLGECFLVEAMVTDIVLELVVGIRRDDQFGLSLVIGSGGRLVQLMEDSVTMFLPAHRTDISLALDALKCAPLMTSYRAGPTADREAAVTAISTVVDYANQERDRLLELDVNPLLVLPEGRGCKVADASIRLSDTRD